MKFFKVNGNNVYYPQLRGSLDNMRYPAFVEIKIDGEFNYLGFKNNNAFTINKYNNTRMDFKQLNQIQEILRNNGTQSAMMLCELFWDRGLNGDLYQLNSHKKDDNVRIGIHDIVELNGKDLKKEPLITRKETLFNIGLRDHIIDFALAHDTGEAMEYFKVQTYIGFEGVIVKALDAPFLNGPCQWVKIKFKDRSDYTVVLIDPDKERIEIATPATSSQLSVFVGVRACNKYKKHIKVGDRVTIEHQGVLASGSLRNPILIPKKEWR